MNYIEEIIKYTPKNDQESQDKKVILRFIEAFPHNVLLRDNVIAHITSSGFTMNEALNRVLMVHHNIRNTWAWTGGHADGESNLLHVAIKEAKEETGVKTITPLTQSIASIDIFPVYGHLKNRKYVNTHLHLSIAYLLIADDTERLIVNKAENSGVNWFSVERFTEDYFDAQDLYLYRKLIDRAKQIRGSLPNEAQSVSILDRRGESPIE